jgi:hypothetical protein
MSKQSEAKAHQGYDPKPVPNTCANCGHFATTRELPKWEVKRNREESAAGHRPRYTIAIHGVEVKPRCTLGGFAVRKSGTCNEFASKVAT